MASDRRPFPLGLTAAAVIGVAILVGLGVWQLKRLAWKQTLLAHVTALKSAPAQPLAAVLTRAAAGADVDFTRVSVECLPPAPGPRPRVFLYAMNDGAIAWRPISACRIDAGAYAAIAVDRGVIDGADGPEPPAIDTSPPAHVTGVLRVPDKRSSFVSEAPGAGGGFQSRRAAALAAVGAGGRAPVAMLVVEHEDPAPAGVTAKPLPADIPNNHLSYALTWFGLAAALAGVYLALLFRKAGAR